MRLCFTGMITRQNPLFWTFAVGTFFDVRLRMSWLIPAIGLFFVLYFGPTTGLLYAFTFLVSLLIHEAGHVIAFRSSGDDVTQVCLFPTGGFPPHDHATSARWQTYGAAGGLIASAILCLITLPTILFSTESMASSFNLVAFPVPQNAFPSDGRTSLIQAQIVLFHFNFFLVAVNLIPAYPFDGGRILRGWLIEQSGYDVGCETSIRSGMLIGIFMGALGLAFLQNPVFVAVGAVILTWAVLEEQYLSPPSDETDDSFLGYDFSQGYTSLDRTSQTSPPPVSNAAPTGFWSSWRARRDASRKEREQKKQEDFERQLDELLAKVHEQGYDSLSPAEKRQLARASARIRGKGNGAT